MKYKLKYCIQAVAGLIVLIGLGAVAGAIGSGIASAGLPHQYPTN